VTHPAYFDRGAVEETREAARQAGFDMTLPQQMLMEPTAAALAYTRTDTRDPLRILTYDLGGGTFDVTYMERIDGVIQIRAFDGNHLLGGYNFDKELVRLVRTRLAEKGRNIVLDERDPADRGRLARLLRIAENVKIELSRTRQETDAVEFRVRNVLVDDKGVSVQVNERVTRQQFVAAIQAWLDEVIECCRRAMEKGKARPDDLHQILLVGGSSYGPWIAESLKAAFPNADTRLFNPDLCVGAGAAIHARMALPQVEELGDYRIERDTPETSVLDHVHVAGRVLVSKTGRPPQPGMSVSLTVTSGSAPAPAELGENGSFLFKDVPLPEEGVNTFTLALKSHQGDVVAQHALTIDHVPPAPPGTTSRSAAAGVTGSTSVLPRPLYIDTARGMVALAEEGVALPARCVASFERTNSNANITLRLFQEQDPVGIVRIENIPKEAGVGSPVDLTIEVTADNQVCGDVVIYRLVPGKTGEAPKRVEALRSPIRVSFDPTAIPAAEELREQFGELQGRVMMLPLLDPYLANEVAAECGALVERIERGFEHQPFERQEVFVDTRRLRNLLVPPKDDMTPSRREFAKKAGQCRRDIEELRNTNAAIVEELKKSGAEELEIDGRKVSARRAGEIVKRLDGVAQKLDEIERVGLDAHARKDRIAWPKGFERLGGLEEEVAKLKPREERPDISALPTPLLKIMVVEQELGRRARLVQRHAQALEARGEFADWRGELIGIMQQLERSRESVLEIDDGTPSAQALARILKVLEQVHGLDARIAAIGKVLA
jgi:molecular chaperone DnaK (HSP70)